MLTVDDRPWTPAVIRHSYTIYLFIKSDVKTILAPITISALLAAKTLSVTNIFHTIFWTWLHLLQFCVSNQIIAPEEDAINKPWRPIPAGRLTSRAAAIFRWLLVPVCVVISASYGTSALSSMLSICIALHNELGFDSHWFTRNLLNAFAYALFDIGAALIACGEERSPEFTSRIVFSGILNSFIIFTTIHAQDFRDEAGDRIEGRQTIPIVAPTIGRVSMPVALSLWSIALSFLVDTHIPITLVVVALGVFVGMRFYQLRSVAADKTSYTWYNVG